MILTSSELQTLQNELGQMNDALEHHQAAYFKFYALSQIGSWEAADLYRVEALAWLEAAMDAFSRACHLQLDD